VTRSSLPPITQVTGGVEGFAASYPAMQELADRIASTAGRLRDHAAADAHALADPALVESAPLSPVTFAEAESRLLEAMTGAHGILEEAIGCETLALLIRAEVAAFQECDRLVAVSLRVLDDQLGEAAGYAARLSAPALVVAGLVAAPAWRLMSERTRRRLGRELEVWLDDHPEAVQHAVDGSGGLLDGLLGVPPIDPTVADAASDLSRLYPPEATPRVVRRRDLATPLGAVAPDDLTGLLRHLRQTNALSPADRPGDQGTIEVQRLRARREDGAAPDRYIVYLPGTDDPTAMPWSHDRDVRDLPADLHVMAGEPAAYTRGIERAMTRAGVGPRDPVLLVGHSLGGMEAATMLARGSGFRVTHVVTAGSPVAGMPGYPAHSHVLSLENRGDVVPLLDGRDNADSRQQVTVQFDDPGRSVLGSHRLGHYVHGAAAAEVSPDASIAEQLASLRAHGFLGSGAAATSQVFQIVR
jgi:hypothetical protein